LAASHPAQIISYQKMLGTLTDAGNVTTIASYLKLLSSAFLVLPLERYSGTAIKQRGSTPKIILLDNALISAMNNLTLADTTKDTAWRGRLTENAVGARIWATIEKFGGELFYWRERNKEVDFVVKLGKELTAIEVKSGQSKGGQNGLEYFLKKNPKSRGLVIHKQLEDFMLNPKKYLLN